MPRTALFAVSILSLIAALLVEAAPPSAYPVDDAYIAYRYARHVAAGQGPVFNLGERVEGFSSPLWVGLLAAAAALGVAPPLAARGLALGSLLAIVATLAAFARPPRTRTWSSGWAACALVVALAHPWTAAQGVSGLETPLVAALVLGLVVHLDAAPGTAGLHAALLALARPEGPLVAAAVIGADAWRAKREGDAPRARSRGRLLLLSTLVPSAGLWCARLAYYGAWLPNTVLAKSGASWAVQSARSVGYLGGFAVEYAPLVALSATVLFVPRLPDERRAIAGIASLAAISCFIGSGDAYPFRRYLFPAVALLALLAARGLQRTITLTRRTRPGWRPSPLLVAGTLAAAVCWQQRFPIATVPGRFVAGIAELEQPLDAPRLDGRGPTTAPLHRAAEWLRHRAPPGTALATSEVGLVGYLTGFRVIDDFGLVNARVARRPGPPGDKARPDDILADAPRFLAFKVERDCLCGATPSDSRVLADPRLHSDYDLARILSAGPLSLFLFERRVQPAIWLDLAEEWTPDRVVFRRGSERIRIPALAAELVGRAGRVPPPREQEEDSLRARLAECESPASPDFACADPLRRWLAGPQRVLYHHPRRDDEAPEIHFATDLPRGAVLRFGLWMPREYWGPEHGDGVEFRVHIAAGEAPSTLAFSRYLDPKHTVQDRLPHRYEVDLSRWAGQHVEIVLDVGPGPVGDSRFDFAGWVEPRIELPDDEGRSRGRGRSGRG